MAKKTTKKDPKGTSQNLSKPSSEKRPPAEKVVKVSNEQFWNTLRENAGIYARTAKAIESKYGVVYSRQAVKDRAEKDLKQLDDIREQTIDIAESGLLTLIQSPNHQVKMRAIEFYLRTIGKKRGFVEKSEIEHSGSIENPMATTVFKIERRKK